MKEVTAASLSPKMLSAMQTADGNLQVLRRANAEKDEIYSIYTSTRAVFFLGTPHRGSQRAEFGETVRQIMAVAGIDTSGQLIRSLRIGSPELEICQEEFMRLYLQSGFKVRSFHEGQGMMTVALGGLNKKVCHQYLRCLFS